MVRHQLHRTTRNSSQSILIQKMLRSEDCWPRHAQMWSSRWKTQGLYIGYSKENSWRILTAYCTGKCSWLDHTKLEQIRLPILPLSSAFFKWALLFSSGNNGWYVGGHCKLKSTTQKVLQNVLFFRYILKHQLHCDLWHSFQKKEANFSISWIQVTEFMNCWAQV